MSDRLPVTRTTQSIVTNQTEELSDSVKQTIRESYANNTLDNYRRWWDRFVNWGGTLPASERQITDYLEAHKDTCAYSTLCRWTVAINFMHAAGGFDKPCNTEAVRLLLRGIKKRQATQGRKPKRTKPLLIQDVKEVFSEMGESLADVRDRTIVTVGFVCAMRRSEIAALRTSHVEFTSQGMTITISLSKTDQTGEGYQFGVPRGKGDFCPVGILQEWLDELGVEPGEDTVIFRRINRWGTILPVKEIEENGVIIQQGLTPKSVGDIIKQRCSNAGYSAEEYTGHCLRSGFCTQSALDGRPNWQIKKISRHKSDYMLGIYIRDGQLYENTPLDGMY